jgi:hypothetical protein
MAAGYLLPVSPCCSISKQRYAYNGQYNIFDQGQPVGKKFNIRITARKSVRENLTVSIALPMAKSKLFFKRHTEIGTFFMPRQVSNY